MKKTTIVIVDDHKLLREMWVQMFAKHSHLEVVGDCGEFEHALRLIRDKRPEIVFLDINLPPHSGMDAVPIIRKNVPGAKIIALSMHNQPAYAKRMLQLGAKGYITKNSSQQEILKAIEEVMNGGKYVCNEIKEKLSCVFLTEEDNTPDGKDLSLREIEIIKLVRLGFTTKEIASELFISARTVEVHRHNILKKLQLKNAAALIAFANNSSLFI